MMNDLGTSRLFMQRALELATLGTGHVSPNPLVGCVIVHDGKIIGEGWHKKYGEAHAEVNAINAVSDKTRLQESTVYVNLEPCSHVGKTPPCVDLLIKHHVKKVVIANVDSNPLVAGAGIKKLQNAGIEVVIGVLAEEGRELNKRFFTFIEKKRPYIILKWAQTADGFIAREDHNSKWISNDLSRQVVHRWRTVDDAVLIGTSTAAHDNPQLNVRYWTGRNPTRIVIDRHLRLERSLNLFDGSQPTLCYNTLMNEQQPNVSFVKIDEGNFVDNMVRDLYNRKIQSVIVEGGSQTIDLFIERKLWDEVRVFISPQTFNKGIRAPSFHGTLISTTPIKDDQLHCYLPVNGQK